MAQVVEVTYASAEELRSDMANFDPAVMCMRITQPGRGIPAGWQLKGMSKQELANLLSDAYRHWPGDLRLTFEKPPEHDEFEGLSPRSTDVVRMANAAYVGDASTVRALLDSGRVAVDAASREKGGATALSFACRGGHVAVARLLLERGGAVDSRNDFEETPLLLAANRALGDVCRLLLAQAADIHATDENGDGALEFLGPGSSERKLDCREVLRAAGCRPRN
eukprot:TRINITY_DN38747_c0_g1_i1.p1 TRINITY_DN38747_c0_g1~~TRINITY_DN38747_c0_g1_i1.p1  ORF type:complete len:223 (-),score=52.83 TRINITY_DN38747_c0_g1_i1:49-717(-)